MASIIKKPGSKFYHAIYRDHQGKQCCRSTKEVNDRRARRIADLFEKAAKKTTSPHRIRRAFNELLEELNPDHAPAVTVREKFEGWLRVKRPALAESTFAAYRKTADRFLGFLGERADEDIAAIDKRTIADFRDSLELSPGTVNNHLKTLRALFLAAETDGHLDLNPTKGVDLAKRSTKRVRRAFTLGELRAIIEIADPEWKSLIRFTIIP